MLILNLCGSHIRCEDQIGSLVRAIRCLERQDHAEAKTFVSVSYDPSFRQGIENALRPYLYDKYLGLAETV